jgi:DNA-binding NarL/FixJ family response regulator
MDRIRTLIADDYPFFRRALKAHLEENCMAVVVGMAANGLDAAAFAEDLAPDLVSMKVQIPGLNGLEACQQIKTRSPRTAVILYTPYGPGAYTCRPDFCADACMSQDTLFDELPPTIQELFSQGNQPLNRCISS